MTARRAVRLGAAVVALLAVIWVVRWVLEYRRAAPVAQELGGFLEMEADSAAELARVVEANRSDCARARELGFEHLRKARQAHAGPRERLERLEADAPRLMQAAWLRMWMGGLRKSARLLGDGRKRYRRALRELRASCPREAAALDEEYKRDYRAEMRSLASHASDDDG